MYAERLEGGIEVVYLNQPRKKNALSGEMMTKLDALLRAADVDDGVRVVVLRGAGDDFSSGGDLDQGPALEPGPEGARKTLRRYLAVVRTIRTMSKPVVAMVDGYAVGGAFALVCASDLVCASERALFVPAFCQIGIVPEMGMMKLLPDLVGPQRAKELLFFGGKTRAPAVRLGRGEPRVPDGNARSRHAVVRAPAGGDARRVHPSHEEHHERAGRRQSGSVPGSRIDGVAVLHDHEGVRRHHGEICPLNPAKVRRYGPVQRSGTVLGERSGASR